MIRVVDAFSYEFRGLPRMRGDDPEAGDTINDAILFAPHARG